MHNIKIRRAEAGYVQSVCSCGWVGRKWYQYTDTPWTDAKREALRHFYKATGKRPEAL